MSANDSLGTESTPVEDGVGREGVSKRPVEGSIAQALDGLSAATAAGEERVVDSRVIAALETYLESLREGARGLRRSSSPSVRRFHPNFKGASRGWSLSRQQPPGCPRHSPPRRQHWPSRNCRLSLDWVTTTSFARLDAEGWVSFTRRCRSRSAGEWL